MFRFVRNTFKMYSDHVNVGHCIGLLMYKGMHTIVSFLDQG